MVVKGICIISLTLGVGILLRFMPSMRASMLWREAYWRPVMDKKYVSQAGGWCSNVVTGSYGVSWKHIKRASNAVSSFVSIKVFDGGRTRFWHNIWCGERSLKETFLELFCIARDNDALVANHMLAHSGEMH